MTMDELSGSNKSDDIRFYQTESSEVLELTAKSNELHDKTRLKASGLDKQRASMRVTRNVQMAEG